MAGDDLCVTRVPIFQGLTRPEQEQVAQFARPRRVAKGGTVLAAGQQLSRLLVMHSGQLKVTHVSASGQEQILRTAGPGDVVGERALLTGHSPAHFVVALEDSQMCVFDHEDLAGLLATHPDLGLRMLRTLSDRLASAERLLTAITARDVTARIAAYLLDLPGRMRDGVVSVELPMAKKDVASYLGTTPEPLSRRLAALVDAEVIELLGRREVVIRDIEALDFAAVPH